MEELIRITKDIKAGAVSPVYFLCGEEAYFIDKLIEFMSETLLSPEERDFNQTVVYGKDIQVEELLAHARRYPMMAERQVIIVKEAQHLSRVLDQFESYIINPQPTTVLIFGYKYGVPDKRKKIFKVLQKHAVLFESKPLRDYEVPEWIRKRLASDSFQIDTKSAAMLEEFLGNDLSKIDKELTKLKYVAAQDRVITPELIEENIGISKDYNIFELKSAVAAKNMTKALRIATFYEQDPKNHPPMMTLGFFYSFFSQLLMYHGLPDPSKAQSELRLPSVAVRELQEAARKYPMKKVSMVVNTLRDFDMKFKGLGVSNLGQSGLLRELIVKIMA